MHYYVYILRCCDSSYYTGMTSDLDWREGQHLDGTGSDYTRRCRPVVCVWSDIFPNKEQAFEVERQIKGWSRAKKEALIRGDFELLHELAKSGQKRNRVSAQ
jgi:predicted GIY-YIG superfamily endonuclease